MNYDECENDQHNEPEISTGISSLLTQGSNEGNEHRASFSYLKVKSGQHKRLPGFQPEFACLTPWVDENSPPYRITALSINYSAGL
jgi:hypothetical protein